MAVSVQRTRICIFDVAVNQIKSNQIYLCCTLLHEYRTAA